MDIDKALKDWEPFANAMRHEDKELIEQMLSELDPQILKSSGLGKDSFEVVAMALILNQQKMIRDLMADIKKQRLARV